MMTNLFSIFDPSSSFKLMNNWIIIFITLIILTPKYWMKSPNLNTLLFKIKNILHSEFKTILGQKNNNGFSILLITLFMFIMVSNITGLLPYVFNSTSHMSITLSLALPLWLSLMIYGWTKQTIYMFAHLTPQSTPTLLMPFMVLIETMSSVIRPLTLAVRLMANMIAGHLLMTLLGNQAVMTATSIMVTVLFVQLLLLILELAVAFIQAYVFSVLLTLYTSEIINH
uniref:ATP synthase subunit a n=1 Tax=Ptenothrix huangshanensis TaxID=2583244 RepID=A0A6H0EXN8_9HEXA|nr:ATP synthase F0 subunit 6 [Ptenothrix huangshanensis]